jgi:hypothetical protein
MWMITVICNALVVFGFWLVGFIAATPAFNTFVQYAEYGEIIPLPIFSDAVISSRITSLIIPVIWLFVSIALIMRVRKKTQVERLQIVQWHTSISVLGGVIIFVLFVIAGVLPFLKFGGILR